MRLFFIIAVLASLQILIPTFSASGSPICKSKSCKGITNKSVCIATPKRRLSTYSYLPHKFLSIESNNNFVTATRSKCGGPWEVFKIRGNTIYNPHWKTYLSCQPNGKLEGNRKKVGGWEQIQVIDLGFPDYQGNQIYALKCLAHKKFIVVEGGHVGGPVNANRTRVGNWEQFTIKPICDYDGRIKGCYRR